MNMLLSLTVDAIEAWKNGIFANEIVPVTIKSKKDDKVVEIDEEFVKMDLDKVSTLSVPCLKLKEYFYFYSIFPIQKMIQDR